MNLHLKKKLLKRFKNLIAVAIADGIIHPKERIELRKKAIASGITDQEIEIMLEEGSVYQFTIPETEDDRDEQLIDMIELAISDGQFDFKEYDLIRCVAFNLGYSEQNLQKIITLSVPRELRVALISEALLTRTSE